MRSQNNFTPALLERFEDRWNYTLLSGNEAFLEQVGMPMLEFGIHEAFI